MRPLAWVLKLAASLRQALTVDVEEAPASARAHLRLAALDGSPAQMLAAARELESGGALDEALDAYALIARRFPLEAGSAMTSVARLYCQRAEHAPSELRRWYHLLAFEHAVAASREGGADWVALDQLAWRAGQVVATWEERRDPPEAVTVLQRYLAHFPGGDFAEEARSWVKTLLPEPATLSFSALGWRQVEHARA